MKVICAFPTAGKTHWVKGNKQGRVIDLDYGKVRDMFGDSFSTEKNRGSNVISRFYRDIILTACYDGMEVVFTNEPHIQYDTKKYEVIYVIPDYSADEWLDRVRKRGDDTKADWVHYIYNNFSKCVEDWRSTAKEKGYLLLTLKKGQFLSDLKL